MSTALRLSIIFLLDMVLVHRAVASTICYPLILAKIRLQWKSPSGKRLYNSMMDVFAKTVKRSGPTGLYVGLQTREGLFMRGSIIAPHHNFSILQKSSRASSHRV